MKDSWTSHYFSLANPIDDDPTDLPHLLERMAATLRELDLAAEEILDLTVASDVTESGDTWWTATIYWKASTDEVQPLRSV